VTSPTREERPRLLHLVLLLSELLGRVPPALLTPALAGIAASAAWPWGEAPLQIAAGALTFLCIAGDGLSLALLPRLNRSFGPVTPPLLALALLRAATTFVIGAVESSWSAFALATGLQLALTAVEVYATWIEPFRLTVTRVRLRSPRLAGRSPLRLLQVSDLHFEGWTARERRLLETAQELAPDLILLTGDYLNLSATGDEAAQAGARELVASLAAMAPAYAIIGSPLVDRPEIVPSIFEGLPVKWLVDQSVRIEVKGHVMRLVGVRCTRNREEDARRLRRIMAGSVEAPFTLLLYHSPDLMPVAPQAGIDLYLAGHTHGGQLRLPLFGALVTSSDFWKRYEAGLYHEQGITLYVSRGLGMEGLGAPRARFLAPPELVLVEIEGQA